MVRVQLNSGERIVGVRYPQMLIAVAERELTEQKKVAQFLQRQRQLQLMNTQQQLQLTHTQQLLSDASSNAASAMSFAADDGTGLTTPGNHAAMVSSQREGEGQSADEDREKAPAQIVVEAVAPVVKKYVIKATTPPVTIKNFFKPKKQSKEPVELTSGDDASVSLTQTEGDVNEAGKDDAIECDALQNGVKRVCTVSDSDDESRDSVDDVISADNKAPTSRDVKTAYICSNEEIADEAENSTSECDSKLDESSKSVHVTSESVGASSKQTTSSLNSTASSHQTGSTVTAGGVTVHKKRSLSSSAKSSASKKSKTLQKSKAGQRSILSSFAKAKTLHEQHEKKAKTCPICDVVFELTTSNVDINEHIDNCLIE